MSRIDADDYFVVGFEDVLNCVESLSAQTNSLDSFCFGNVIASQNAIDLDQEALQTQLAIGTEGSFAAAKAIYQQGAFSKNVASVTLDLPLGTALSKGTPITGTAADGSGVVGKAYEDSAAGATNLLVQYKTSDSQNSYVECQVGANPNPNTSGCFAATGTLVIDGANVGYKYDPLVDNVAKRTIAGFSTSAQKKMAECGNCPYPTYQKYYEYYGAYDYANQIVLAGFEGSRTTFSNFNNDFGIYDFAGREQIIKKGTAYMNIYMYVIREMEDALDDCQEGCTVENCNDDPVHAWDEGVAFYTGSLEGTDGSGSGNLMYALADKRCNNFKTCGDLGDSTTGTSKVNIEIFKNFGIGKNKINRGECASARAEKETIEKLMMIPLIQGTLRYAWKTDVETYSEKAEAEGTIFALSIAPMVAACDPAAARVIEQNLFAGQRGAADFAAVKAAFEDNYECMGVDGAMVGGLYDSAMGTYYAGASPSSSSTLSVAVGAGVAAITALSMFL